MSNWFSRVASTARYEVSGLIKRPWELATGLLFPVVWCLLVASIFGTGIMQRLPVGIVDLDASPASRELVMTLDAIPSMSLVGFHSPLEAETALKSAKTYATIVIPRHWQRDNLKAQGGTLEVFINKTYYPVGTIVEVDLKTALASEKMQALAVKLTGRGGTFAENARHLRASIPDVYFYGNTAFNFSAYLLPTIIPGLIALGAGLCFMGVLVREWREGGVRTWLKSAQGDPFAAIVGKLLPWVSMYLLVATAWVAYFGGWAGWAPVGSLSIWIIATILLILAMAGLALFFASFAPTWVIGTTIMICLIAPTFPFTGFSFPNDAMGTGAELFGELLPLTHYLHAQAQCWVLGSPLDVSAITLLKLFGFLLLGLVAGMPLLAGRIRHWAQNEHKAQGLYRAYVSTGGANIGEARRD